MVRGKLGLVFVVVLVGLIVAGCGDDTSKSGGDEQPETSEPDTGRMSGEEYDQLKLYTRSFGEESEDFIGAIAGKCGNLAGAGELAAASTCFEDAYDGVDTKAGAAYSVYSDLIKSTTRGCRRSIRRLRTALDRYATSLKVVENIGENLTPGAELGELAGQAVTVKRTTFGKRRADAFAKCAPQ